MCHKPDHPFVHVYAAHAKSKHVELWTSNFRMQGNSPSMLTPILFFNNAVIHHNHIFKFEIFYTT